MKKTRILAFVVDLLFSSRIEEATRSQGFELILVENPFFERPYGDTIPDKQYAEHLIGPGAELIDKVTLWQPALIIFDLDNDLIPWRDWISLLKSAPATRRIPVVCFGSHREVEKFRMAREAGADKTVARLKFTKELNCLISSYARKPDYKEIENTCDGKLSQLAIEGIELFNHGEYFEAHEVLEKAWNDDQSLGRDLYRAIIQVAVAYLQIERKNYKGAKKMFLRMRQWFDLYPDQCRGVSVSKLKEDAGNAHEELTKLGPERISEFNREFFKPVLYGTSANIKE